MPPAVLSGWRSLSRGSKALSVLCSRLKTVPLEGKQPDIAHAEKRIYRPSADASRASPGIVPGLAQFQSNLGTLTGLYCPQGAGFVETRQPMLSDALPVP